MPADPTVDLRVQLAADRVVPCVGAGFSISTARLPTWSAAVESALSHALAVGLSNDVEVQAARDELRRGNLVEAARVAKRLLGAPHGEFPFWLKSTFSGASVARPSSVLADAISDLCAPLIATTNYDRLLSDLMVERPVAVSWRDSVQVREAVRDGGTVLHLHGVYTDPESVIFGIDNYQELAAHSGYEAVIRSLWLERTLLFIGCSFDGLRDPDFSKLLDWASATFPGSPTKHYAFIHQADVTPDRVKEFLLRWRIQIIPYGPGHDDLPAAIRGVNPNADRAEARRILLVSRLIENSPPDARQRIADVLRSLPADTSAERPDYDALAASLLERRNRSADQLREDLVALQTLARGMVSRAELRAEIERYEDHAVREYDASFRRVVVSAENALALFPVDLLNALKRRNVNLHQNWLAGHASTVLARLERRSSAGVTYASSYDLENAKRILSSLQAILDADPERVLPRRAAGIRSEIARGQPYLLVGRHDRVELRPCTEPATVAASLPLEKSLGTVDLAMTTFRGEPAVLVADRESLSVWDPTRAASLLATFSVGEAFGISGTSHTLDGAILRSTVATTNGPVHELADLQAEHTWTPMEGFLTYPVRWNDGRLFALSSGLLPVVQVDATRDKALRPLVSATDIRKLLKTLPAVVPQIERRLELDREYLGGDVGLAKSISWDELNLQHLTLHRVELTGRMALLLNVTIEFLTGEASVIFFFSPGPKSVELVGHLFLDGLSVTDVELAPGEDGRMRLYYSLLSNFEENRDLVGWARATRSAQGLVFVGEGTALRAYDDLIEIAFRGDRGFAADDNGGLFEFRPSDRSAREIDRNRQSKIDELQIVQW